MNQILNKTQDFKYDNDNDDDDNNNNKNLSNHVPDLCPH